MKPKPRQKTSAEVVKSWREKRQRKRAFNHYQRGKIAIAKAMRSNSDADRLNAILIAQNAILDGLMESGN